MTKTIHRYELGTGGINEVKMPADAIALSCGWWKGEICVWAIHEVGKDTPPEPEYEIRRFQVCATGEHHHPLPGARCLGVVLIHEHALCFHVFEDVKEE